MSKVSRTLLELTEGLRKNNIKFVLTRFVSLSKKSPGDIDILVKPAKFDSAIDEITKKGYKTLSHDQALGGRIEGAQVNLVKKGMVKIDLHKDFTWRKKRYFDLSLIWDNLSKKSFERTTADVPLSNIDAFIIAVNIIFEKTYLLNEDFLYLKKHLKEQYFTNQAKKYGWLKTYNLFYSWWTRNYENFSSFPVFLPTNLVLYSYTQKFHLVSLLYYIFFRLRYLINKRLPYD